MTENLSDPELEAILQSLQQFEKRIARLEMHLGLTATESVPAPNLENHLADSPAAAGEEAGLEQSIGEFGLAWAGSIVFLLGIVFLMTYTLNQGHNLFPAVMGYCAAAGLYALARVWQRGFPYLARILVSASLLLTYYTTLRLHYFTSTPLVKDRQIALALLLLVVAFQISFALVIRSQALLALGVLLGLMSALLSDTTHAALSLVAVHSALAVYLALRRDWWRLLNLTIVLGYITHVLWLLNNPLVGRPLGGIGVHQFSLTYLFLSAAVFAWPTLFYDRDAASDAGRVGVVFLNCVGFCAVVSLAVLALFPKDFAMISLAACLLLLACSAVQWLRTHIQLAAATYACCSYMALSIAIYGFAKVPEAFLWLALQSFLVVSMALWFRSRILVVVNAIIYIGILLAYWVSSPPSDLVNFSFALVALGSARVMNWQKERLTLRTDGLRNVYLATTFVMVLYSLYHAVPASYVTLSWTATAVAYFLLSQLLKNVKYRWMSLFTLAATVLYLFLVDLARLDLRFRVVAFLFLGLMAVGISLFYTKLRQLGRKQ
ncbi:MAG: DUF2339 domain-containing protein [Acidobacteriia bacterium]|nr:DUF2339 domain-containing protein [Terriglobia bacterium]